MRLNVVLGESQFLVIISENQNVGHLAEEIVRVHALVAPLTATSQPVGDMSAESLLLRNSVGSVLINAYPVALCLQDNDVVYGETMKSVPRPSTHLTEMESCLSDNNRPLFAAKAPFHSTPKKQQEPRAPTSPITPPDFSLPNHSLLNVPNHTSSIKSKHKSTPKVTISSHSVVIDPIPTLSPIPHDHQDTSIQDMSMRQGDDISEANPSQKANDAMDMSSESDASSDSEEEEDEIHQKSIMTQRFPANAPAAASQPSFLLESDEEDQMTTPPNTQDSAHAQLPGARPSNSPVYEPLDHEVSVHVDGSSSDEESEVDPDKDTVILETQHEAVPSESSSKLEDDDSVVIVDVKAPEPDTASHDATNATAVQDVSSESEASLESEEEEGDDDNEESEEGEEEEEEVEEEPTSKIPQEITNEPSEHSDEELDEESDEESESGSESESESSSSEEEEERVPETQASAPSKETVKPTTQESARKTVIQKKLTPSISATQNTSRLSNSFASLSQIYQSFNNSMNAEPEEMEEEESDDGFESDDSASDSSDSDSSAEEKENISLPAKNGVQYADTSFNQRTKKRRRRSALADLALAGDSDDEDVRGPVKRPRTAMSQRSSSSQAPAARRSSRNVK